MWILRILWLALPLLAWEGVADALSGRSRPVELMVAVIGLTGWFTGLVALFAPSTVSLTGLRVVAPAASLFLAAILYSGEVSISNVTLALVPAVLAGGISLLPAVGDVW